MIMIDSLCEQQLLRTSIFTDCLFVDVPVWSKLQTGRLPSPPELFQIVDNHLKLMNNMDGFPPF
jgi:hypothetical protein